MIRSGLLCLVLLSCCAICLCVEAGSASAFGMEICAKKTEGTPTPGKFEDSECTKSASSGEWQRFEPHEGLAMSASSVGALQFTSTFAGAPIAFQCSSLSNTGGFGENIEEAGVKKVVGKGKFLKYGGCTVSKPTGCTIGAGGFETKALKLLAVAEGGVTKVKFEPETGTTIASVVIAECVIAGTYLMKGSLVGTVPSSEESRVKFTSGSGSSLTLGGNLATYTGTTKVVKEGTTEPIFFGS